ncbi:hypothetical protein ERJ75_001725200 [Trypanosoma vivax]|nr:hypothetical protein ERJ75_001725200 [Trypanosoma vivax]
MLMRGQMTRFNASVLQKLRHIIGQALLSLAPGFASSSLIVALRGVPHAGGGTVVFPDSVCVASVFPSVRWPKRLATCSTPPLLLNCCRGKTYLSVPSKPRCSSCSPTGRFRRPVRRCGRSAWRLRCWRVVPASVAVAMRAHSCVAMPSSAVPRSPPVPLPSVPPTPLRASTPP